MWEDDGEVRSGVGAADKKSVPVGGRVGEE